MEAEPFVARDATYHRAPERLRASLRSRLSREASRTRILHWRRFLALGAAFACVAFFSWHAALLTSPHLPQDAFEREVVTAHVRSLLVESHFNDVVSTDRHTVKPWFTGRIDFAPPVEDHSASGFTLTGGRVDYLEGRTVAVVTYRARSHAVNLFIWPSQSGDAPARISSRQGFSIVRWSRAGMEFCAVSDVAPNILTALPGLVPSAS